MNQRPKPVDFFHDWNQREALAEGMIPLVAKLYREHNVSLYMYGRTMVSQSVTDLMKSHAFVRRIEQNEISEFETYPMIEALASMDLGPAHVDVGKLTVLYQERAKGTDRTKFLQQEVGDEIGRSRKPLSASKDIVLYGFGRIGRLVSRLLIEKTGGGDICRLRAVVIRKGSTDHDLNKRAALLLRDSVHGPFEGTIQILEDENCLVCNGNKVQFIVANSPAEVNYEEYGISDAIVVDNTGIWRDEAGLRQHLRCPGVAKVILTAPGKGGIPNVVYGINHDAITDDCKIVSAASCTTNAIVPILKALHQNYGIQQGHVETVHSYTNDQNLIDNYHKGSRRGRGAALNMVLTETGAAKAVAKAVPELAGRLTGSAIRVPTPNVSLAILMLQLEKEASRDEINEYVRQKAFFSPLQQQIGYSTSDEVVSSDFNGNRDACVFDSQNTTASGKSCVLYCWYDNEFGYSCQVVRCIEKMAGVEWVMVPTNQEL